MDFTFKKLSVLLDAAGSGDFRVINHIRRGKGSVIRHDVDASLSNALKIARLEHSKSIRTSYYFRIPQTFDVNVIDEISNLGHEVGFHYEVLDKMKGDVVGARQLFEREFKLFERWDLKTICMHGNPLTSWDNQDIWEGKQFRSFGIMGDAYLSIDFGKIDYFTDTGRGWNKDGVNLKDRPDQPLLKVRDTDQLIALVEGYRVNGRDFYLQMHPVRWNDNLLSWSKELVWQNLKNVGKLILSRGARR